MWLAQGRDMSQELQQLLGTDWPSQDPRGTKRIFFASPLL